ncbi:HD domain-containing protein [Hydromonas duriensis]|uniref:5'-deoxynucleotidase n=1 Tax=Hydromonas duriensis TaxID=1527608 RepID=A0A4R6Y9M5_9BURK|nr:HD domain-containing protein [Hydromonas duriensis]TDR32188.1 putative hydrolase of HD superfamily [Hydromonas duriensis]
MEKIIDFIIEIDKLKTVTRKTKPLGLDRYENSAEHSWQIALLATSLSPYAPEPLDINRVILMLLVHDIGEIDTGDTIAFAEVDWTVLKAEELAAVKRIFGILPIEQAHLFLYAWQEFETGNTPEARFAHAADRAMPVLLNLANQGQSWRENGISYERVVRRIKAPIAEGCPALWAYLEKRLDEAKKQSWFGA